MYLNRRILSKHTFPDLSVNYVIPNHFISTCSTAWTLALLYYTICRKKYSRHCRRMLKIIKTRSDYRLCKKLSTSWQVNGPGNQPEIVCELNPPSLVWKQIRIPYLLYNVITIALNGNGILFLSPNFRHTMYVKPDWSYQVESFSPSLHITIQINILCFVDVLHL